MKCLLLGYLTIGSSFDQAFEFAFFQSLSSYFLFVWIFLRPSNLIKQPYFLFFYVFFIWDKLYYGLIGLFIKQL